MAFGGHTTWYASSVKWSAVTTWATGVVKAAGALVKQTGTPTVGNERVYAAIVGGTTGGGADPLTVFTRGNKITDNTITWQEVTGIPAFNGDLTNTPNWVASRAVSTSASLGHTIKDAAGTHIFIASVAGTVGAVEPTWDVAAVGNTTADNTTTWVYMGTSFANWAAPHSRIQNMLASGWGDSGVSVNFYVGNDHAETQAANVTWTARGTNAVPISIVGVNVAGSVPPVAADVATGAAFTVTGNNSWTSNGAFRVCSGIVFTVGTTGNCQLNLGSDALMKLYKDCTFAFGAGAGSGSQFSSTENAAMYIELENCNFKPSNAGHQWQPRGRVRWNGGTLDISVAAPTTWLTTGSLCDLDIRNVDLDGLSTKTLMTSNQSNLFSVRLRDCKVPASWTVLTPASMVSREQRCTLSRCASSAVPYISAVYDYQGAITTETTVVRTGGATAGGVKFSWKYVTSATPNWGHPLPSLPFSKYNTTIDPTTVTVTVYGLINAAAVPNDTDLWLIADYLGSATSAQGSTKTSRPATSLTTPTALTADSTSAWTAVASARANTTAYAVGDTLKVASNAGRLFFCTTLGTTAGSEPVGYASAIDGGSVTDGTAVFRAACRFSMAVALSSPKVQIGGMIHCTVCAAKVSTTTYIDPYINLS